MKIVISSGHGKYIRGAADIIDEVDEARRVVNQTAEYLRRVGVETITFHDDVSTTQDENLHRIVDFHNDQERDLDISVHFNAFEHTAEPMGTEVLYLNEDELAEELSEAIAEAAGFIDRGEKLRDDLYFLNQTDEPAVLIEVCFVDSVADTDLYTGHFDEICRAIAMTAAGSFDGETPAIASVGFSGKVSWFGGPDDTGVSPDEGLAFIYDYDEAPHLFLKQQPPGTTGLARRLNPAIAYVACRWDYDVTPREMLADTRYQALVIAPRTGKRAYAWPADWGPNENTGRVADLSPGLMSHLEIDTDDEVEVIYPAPSSASGA
jgi:hypothetical protein